MTEAAHPGTDAYAMAELMAVEMARNLAAEDSRIGGVGAAAVVPMAASRLAALTVAPNLWWFCGGASALNPTFDRLPRSSADPRAGVGAEGRKRMLDVVDMGMTRKWGWGFNGGLQVDRHGNLNMLGIGRPGDLKLRGPGTVGSIWLISVERAYLYVMHHNPRVIVDRVDFVTGPGFLDGGDARWRWASPDSEGPVLLYTPICVMDFTPDAHTLRLRSVNPGYTVDDVLTNTGCAVMVPEHVPETAPPSAEELTVLRRQVDRDGILAGVRMTVG